MTRFALALLTNLGLPRREPVVLLAKATKPRGCSDPRGPFFLIPLLAASLSGCVTVRAFEAEQRERKSQDFYHAGELVKLRAQVKDREVDADFFNDRLLHIERLHCCEDGDVLAETEVCEDVSCHPDGKPRRKPESPDFTAEEAACETDLKFLADPNTPAWLREVLERNVKRCRTRKQDRAFNQLTCRKDECP